MSDYSNAILIPVLALPAGSCAWAASSAFKWRKRRARKSETWIWAGFALFFLACIAMKLGRTVAAFDDIARGMLRQDGFYNDRRTIQVIALCVVGLVLAVGLWQLPRMMTRWRRYRWTIIGILMIAGVAIIRAISLHQVDELGKSMVWLKVAVEGGASTLAAWGALARVRELSLPAAAGGADA